MEIKINVKHNFKKIDKIVSELPRKISESVEEILKNIQGYAIKLERGHNSEGILIELVDVLNNEIKGRVFANPEKFIAKDSEGNDTNYLFFEYFGTGSYAEMDHIGKSKHFKETGYTEWYIPKNKVLRPLSYPVKIINGKEFYVATGAKPNHFMSDAEFKTREENIEIVKAKINELFEEACK